MNILSVNFGNISNIKDYKRTKPESGIKTSFIDKPSSIDSFEKIKFEAVSDFEEEDYSSIEGKKRWLDEAEQSIHKRRSSSRFVMDKFVELIFSNSLMEDLKKAKKEGKDEAVGSFFNKAYELGNKLNFSNVDKKSLDDAFDGIDILEYSYENDSLHELTYKKESSVLLQDFIDLSSKDLSDEKRSKIEEGLDDYFDEAFLVAPKPVLKLEMQIDPQEDDNVYMSAFKAFLKMAKDTAEKYKDDSD